MRPTFHSADDPHRYDDMLRLPHPVSTRHPPMSLLNRAAQFSPFAALSGYDAEVAEAGRMTDRRLSLSESEKAALDERLHVIQRWLDQRPSKWTCPAGEASGFSMPEVSITYFVADPRKAGGSYVATTGTVKRIDLCVRSVVMTGGCVIPIEDIAAIESDAFRTDCD